MTVRELLQRAAVAEPSRPYLFFRDDAVSYGDIIRRVDALASALQDVGVRTGDHVALILPNRPEFLYSWFALATLGAVMVPLNPALTHRELGQILAHSDAIGVITDSAHVNAVHAVRGETRVRWIATADRATGNDLRLADMLERAPSRPDVRPFDDSAVAALVYTSGTTGTPRGVIKTHRSYTRVALEIPVWLAASPEDRVFNCLPLFHTNAQIYATLASLAWYGSLVLAERFSASRFWEAAASSGATIVNYVGTMLAILARTPATPAERQHRVRAAFGGGASAEIEHVFRNRFGVRLVEGYGLTEASVVTIRGLENGGAAGSSGWPAPYCRVRIVGEDGRDCTPGCVGEIAVSQSEVLMAGYYKDPVSTAAAVKDGWLFTGDLGWRDASGNLHFAGRKKDIIRYRGENVSPVEVEAVLLSHSAVAEAAVVGRPSEIGDEDVCAVVVPVEGKDVSAEDLREHCRQRLAPFKVPVVVEFRSALPKTSTHKIRRELLRQPVVTSADGPRP